MFKISHKHAGKCILFWELCLQFHRCGGGLGWLNTDKQSKLSNLVIKLTIQRSYIAPSHELCVIDIFKSAFRKGQF